MKCKDCKNLRDIVTYDENGDYGEPVFYCGLDEEQRQFSYDDVYNGRDCTNDDLESVE